MVSVQQCVCSECLRGVCVTENISPKIFWKFSCEQLYRILGNFRRFSAGQKGNTETLFVTELWCQSPQLTGQQGFQKHAIYYWTISLCSRLGNKTPTLQGVLRIGTLWISWSPNLFGIRHRSVDTETQSAYEQSTIVATEESIRKRDFQYCQSRAS